MKTVTLGKSNLKLSSVIMGMWQAGKQYWVGIDDREIEKAIEAALDQGITTFDTAEEYGNGHSERTLGKALQGKRDQVLLLTKVFSHHLKYDQVLQACHQSLKNLKTETIDLYQIHWPSGSWGSEKVPVEETMRALNQLKKEGKIRAIGVSNFNLEQMQEVCRYGQIDSLQSPWSLFFRHIENEILPFCLENQITLLAYSPLAQGFLTGKFGLQTTFDEKDNRRNNRLNDPKILPFVAESIHSLRKIAERKSCSPAQLALAWIANHTRCVPIAGARNAAQITDSAKADALTLTAEEAKALEEATRPVSEKFKKEAIPWGWNP